MTKTTKTGATRYSSYDTRGRLQWVSVPARDDEPEQDPFARFDRKGAGNLNDDPFAMGV